MSKKSDAADASAAADAAESLDQPVTRRDLLAFCYANGILPAPPADTTHTPSHAAVWDDKPKDEPTPEPKKGHA